MDDATGLVMTGTEDHYRDHPRSILVNGDSDTARTVPSSTTCSPAVNAPESARHAGC